MTSAKNFKSIKSHLPGFLISVVIGVFAYVLGSKFKLIGSPVIAIVSGVVVAILINPSRKVSEGFAFTSKVLLKLSVVLLGFELSFGEVLKTSIKTLPIMLGTLLATLIGGIVVGKLLKVPKDEATLIGVGTAICGASAIAATDSVIEADRKSVAYSVSTIFLFNVIAVLTFPLFGHMMRFSQQQFGTWAGTSINDLSSVVAAAQIYGKASLSQAVVVKLTRTLAIVPIAIVLGILKNRGQDGMLKTYDQVDRFINKKTVLRIFPGFILWFLLAVLANSLGVIPVEVGKMASSGAIITITIALGAIGLSTKIRDIVSTGYKPLLLGLILWVIALTSSLFFQFVV